MDAQTHTGGTINAFVEFIQKDGELFGAEITTLFRYFLQARWKSNKPIEDLYIRTGDLKLCKKESGSILREMNSSFDEDQKFIYSDYGDHAYDFLLQFKYIYLKNM